MRGKGARPRRLTSRYVVASPFTLAPTILVDKFGADKLSSGGLLSLPCTIVVHSALQIHTYHSFDGILRGRNEALRSNRKQLFPPPLHGQAGCKAHKSPLSSLPSSSSARRLPAPSFLLHFWEALLSSPLVLLSKPPFSSGGVPFSFHLHLLLTTRKGRL